MWKCDIGTQSWERRKGDCLIWIEVSFEALVGDVVNLPPYVNWAFPFHQGGSFV